MKSQLAITSLSALLSSSLLCSPLAAAEVELHGMEYKVELLAKSGEHILLRSETGVYPGMANGHPLPQRDPQEPATTLERLMAWVAIVPPDAGTDWMETLVVPEERAAHLVLPAFAAGREHEVIGYGSGLPRVPLSPEDVTVLLSKSEHVRVGGLDIYVYLPSADSLEVKVSRFADDPADPSRTVPIGELSQSLHSTLRVNNMDPTMPVAIRIEQLGSVESSLFRVVLQDGQVLEVHAPQVLPDGSIVSSGTGRPMRILGPDGRVFVLHGAVVLPDGTLTEDPQ